MNHRDARTLAAISAHPGSANIRWQDIESLLRSLGADIQESDGSRVAVVLFGQVQVFHRPHPQPVTDRGAVASIRRWLEANGIKP